MIDSSDSISPLPTIYFQPPPKPLTSSNNPAMTLSKAQILELRLSLQQAVVSCSERCLYQSSKWMAALLSALPEHDVGEDVSSVGRVFNPPANPAQLYLEQTEFPKYLLAKSLFDCREFQRCASVFLPRQSIRNTWTSRQGTVYDRISRKALFLTLYALLIAGEKQKTEQKAQVLGTADNGATVNQQLPDIRQILQASLDQTHEVAIENDSSQGWLEYLYGLVLAKDKNEDLAILWLLRSVSLYPWNWGAWQQLSSLIRSAQHLNWVQSQLKPGILALIFSVHCRLEMHQANPTLVSEISQLQSVFPHSLFLESQRALAFYYIKDLYEANLLFSKVLALDPRYLDFFDHYSNVLYNLGSHDRLAFVAQLASSVDSHRPETCLVIGNYYSLSSRPEAAITSFRRALVLDRSCSAAWTLLGHEYLKAQNTHAAIESYRHAISHARHDYRALFGLGQAYDALEQPDLSLHYYLRASTIRPSDTDLLQAVATGLAAMSRLEEAIKVLKRALACSASEDGVAAKQTRAELLFRLGSLYNEAHNREEATACLEMCLDKALEGEATCRPAGTSERLDMAMIPKAQLLLAQWAVEDGDCPRARYFASQIEQQSELGREAQDVLSRCSAVEDSRE
ncbi:anaphase promoting complex subunit 8 [Chaetomium sp. MPI-SDFR-AT-0129]|nr:anaphase promoting complex subunit 8 [Chaetomium sp. MPI-SDFR-AT-0129]